MNRTTEILICALLASVLILASKEEVSGQQNVRVLQKTEHRLMPIAPLAANQILYIQWNATRTASDIAVMNDEGSGRQVLTQIGSAGSRVIDLEYTAGSQYVGFTSPMLRGRTPLLDDGFLVDLDAGYFNVWTSPEPQQPAATKSLTVHIEIMRTVNSLFLGVKGNAQPLSFGPRSGGASLTQVVEVPRNDPNCWVSLFCSYGIGDFKEFNSENTNEITVTIGTLSSGTTTATDIHPSLSGNYVLNSYELRNDHVSEPYASLQSFMSYRVSKEFSLIGQSATYSSVNEPTLSRDEQMLAYCMGQSMMNSLIVTSAANPTGGDVIVQGGYETQSGLFYNVMTPAWSQDGQRLAFVMLVLNPNTFEIRSDVYRVNRDGTDLRRLTQFPGNKIAEAPSFSSDDRTIAFTVYTSSKSSFTTDELMTAPRDIALVPSGGGSVRYITSDGTCSSPCYAGVASTATDPVSIPQDEIEISVHPYPVRQSSQIIVRTPEEAEYSVTMYDLMGRVVQQVYQGRITGGRLQYMINSDSLPTGTYILSVVGSRHTKSKILTIIH